MTPEQLAGIDRRAQSLPTKRVQRVTTGKVMKRKQSLGSKFMESFTGEDAQSVGGYILWDVLVPALKNTISDIVKGGIEMLLFGERNSPGRTIRDRDKTYVSYNSVSRRPDNKDMRYRLPRQTPQHNHEEVILATRSEAEQVLSHMTDCLMDYGSVSVADLYELAGTQSHEFTLNKYGWTDLRTANVRPVRGGYLLDLPRPRPID
jgi:hypothetical protein